MPRLTLIALLVLVHFGTAPASAEPFVPYADHENGFSIGYPAHWKIVPISARYGVTVAPRDPEGLESCSVTVAPNVLPAGTKVDAVVAGLLSSDAYQDALQAYFPGARVIEKGQAAVLGLPAIYAVYRYRHVSLGVTLDLETIVVATWWNGAEYRAMCTTDPASFDQFRPLFVDILSTFMVTDG